MKKTTILLIEDNRILRDGVKALINKQVDPKIVGANAGNYNTLHQARRLKPQGINHSFIPSVDSF